MRSALIVALIFLTACDSPQEYKDRMDNRRVEREKEYYWTAIPAPEPGYSCYMYGGWYRDNPSGVVCLKAEN
jgi:hypothetical protein